MEESRRVAVSIPAHELEVGDILVLGNLTAPVVRLGAPVNPFSGGGWYDAGRYGLTSLALWRYGAMERWTGDYFEGGGEWKDSLMGGR